MLYVRTVNDPAMQFSELQVHHLPESDLPPLTTGVPLPLMSCKVAAGFPSPADDFNTKRVDLNEVLITHPQATFLLRVRGDSMREAGIFDNDVLIVNRAIRPMNGHIVVAQVDGEFTVKYLRKRAGRVWLAAANPTYPDIVPRDGQTLEVWGVTTAAIKQFKA